MQGWERVRMGNLVRAQRVSLFERLAGSVSIH
jgi:hypothetical protein